MSAYLKISKFFLFLAPFSVFLVTTNTLFPFIVGKYSFFRTVVDLSLIFLMLAWGSGKVVIRWEDFKKPIAIGVAAWVVVFLLASLFAYDPWAAFWGNFERGESGIQLLHLFIFFFLLTVLLRDKDDWIAYLKVVLSATVLVIIYGLLAGRVANFVGPAFSFNTRFQGSLGNPDYIGQFMLFALFFALYLFFNVIKKHQVFFYAFFSLLFFVIFILSQTRGAFLGFVAGIFMTLIYLVFSYPSKKGKILSFVLLVLFLVGVGGFIYFRHHPFIKNLPVVGRFADISLKAGERRIWAWQSAWEGVKERPLLGWGPENFSVVFDKYFVPSHFDPNYGGETWFDRAHSVIFDYAAETGILGLLAYLGLWVFYYIQFFKFLRVRKNIVVGEESSKDNKRFGAREIFVFALFFAMPVVYIVTGATLFDVLPIYIMLFIFLAFTNHYFDLKQKVGKKA